MIRLIEEAKSKFNKGNLNAKLGRRFWQAIKMYDKDIPYAEIKKLLYGCRTASNKEHRKIYNNIL